MPLDPVILDDLAWDDLMTFARGRIPGASSGRWTLHAPVDPGITILELYASLLEQRLFWMDGASDDRGRALLRLLGASPRPAAPASTVLSVAARAPIPAGSAFQPEDPGPMRSDAPPSRFSTRDAITPLPMANGPGPVGLIVAGTNRSIDLRNGRAPRLLPARGDLVAGAPQEADIILWLQGPMPDSGPPIGLLLDVVAPSSVVPEWLPGAVDLPPPARITWWYHGPKGEFLPFDPSAVSDGTGGLRRPGIVRLPLPGAGLWRPGPTASEPGRTPYHLRIRVEGAWPGTPPKVNQIVPNAVVVTHAGRTGATQATRPDLARQVDGWNTLPGMTLDLPEAAGRLIPGTVEFWLEEFDGTTHLWTPREDFSRSGPADRHLVADREHGRLLFGDGYNGRIPRPESQDPTFALSYALGGGVAGNFEGERDWTAPDGSARATNVVPARGGAEAEDVAAAIARTAGQWGDITRAVTAPDFERLAETTPGAAIGRAHAEIGVHPDFPGQVVPGAVTVSILPDRADPDDPSPPRPDPGAIEAVRRRLDAARLIAQEVYVTGPFYRETSLAVTLAGRPDDPSAVRADVASALTRFLNPLSGGFDGRGWPFGGAIPPSALMGRIASVLEGGLDIVRVAIRPGNGVDEEACVDVTIPRDALVRLLGVEVVFVDRAGARGVLS